MKREIIHIDENKCNGCGLCIPNCPEGALQVIDGKARLISDLFCDGLGACIGHCPEGAITIEKREAEVYDERKVMGNIVKEGENVIKAHLEHLKEHNQTQYLKEALDYLKEKGIKIPVKKEDEHFFHSCNCPGSKMMDFREKNNIETTEYITVRSELRQWPVQLHLLNPNAPYFKDADIVIAADCVPFAYADFHNQFLKDKILIIFCPKLDNANEIYVEKLAEIFTNNNIKSVSIIHMEVPCCFGIEKITEMAVKKSGKDIPVKKHTISLKGEIK